MISQTTIQEVKARVNIVDVIKEFVSLKRSGPNEIGLCPFHNEKSGSFTVSAAKQIYKCFGCGASGDAIRFLQDHQGMDYAQAITWLASKYSILVELSGEKKSYSQPIPRLEKLNKKHLDYFKNRGISNDTLLRMKVTEGVEWMPQYKKEVPVVCFNYYRGEELVNIKFRGPQKSFKMAKDAELIFYNLNGLEGQNEAVITEGEIDALTAVECEIYNSVSVPNGAAKGNQKLEYLDNCWEIFDRLDKLILAVDNDQAGSILKEELARRLGKHKCYTVVYPDGCKDLNDVLVKYGKNEVKKVIAEAKEWPIEGIYPVDDMLSIIQDYYENGYPPGAKTRIPGLDDLLTFGAGHLTTVTGIPGHGKDEFTNEIMVSLARHENWVWGVFNFEEPPEIHVTKLMEKHAKKAFAFRRNPESRMNKNEFERAVVFVDDYFKFVKADSIDVSMKGIISKATEMVKKWGINGILINPWNLLEHKLQPGQSETHYVSETLTELNNFLWKYGVHGILIAHPSKMQTNKTTGKPDIPTLYSISGSAHFFNKTYNGITVYRDVDMTDVYVQKVKFYWMGQRGFSSYSFNTETRQYRFEATSVVKSSTQGLIPLQEAEARMTIANGWLPFADNLDKEEDSF